MIDFIENFTILTSTLTRCFEILVLNWHLIKHLIDYDHVSIASMNLIAPDCV